MIDAHKLRNAYFQIAPYGARNEQNFDLFDLPKSSLEWELLWIENQLRANGMLRKIMNDQSDRWHNALLIWQFGKANAWQKLAQQYELISIFAGIISFVGLQIIDPKEYFESIRKEIAA